MSDISIDFGSALPYLEDKIRALFGHDVASVEARSFIDRHVKVALREASFVQIVGMRKPVRIDDVYQPTRLQALYDAEAPYDVAHLLANRESAVIFGGPGRGKTMLMRYLFARLAQRPEYAPILFTLRRENAVEDLRRFVEILASGRRKVHSTSRLVLLVDGFDEIATMARESVVDALRRFSALEVGSFYLTCRAHYAVDDVAAFHHVIAPFTREDSVGFVNAFARAYGAAIDAERLIRELEARGFRSFASHPLMLALVCILKSGPVPDLPASPVRLLRRAVDTLTFRWDHAKGIQRESHLDLDGEDRVRCLMAVAYAMMDLAGPVQSVEQSVRRYLKLLHRQDIPAEQLLEELAKWYGILVPISDDRWTFVHKTLHDFLAARYWIESGRFSLQAVQVWNSRVAYAAALMPDATDIMVAALSSAERVPVFAEALSCGAVFHRKKVSDAIMRYFQAFPNRWSIARKGTDVSISTRDDFFPAAGDELLHTLATGALRRTSVGDLVTGYAVSELSRRGVPLSLVTFNELKRAYRGDVIFRFSGGRTAVALSAVAPHPQPQDCVGGT